MTYLEFDDALKEFKKFLVQQQQPPEIKWVRSSQTIYLGDRWVIAADTLDSSEESIREEYELATSQPLGVSFSVVCANNRTSFCHMHKPTDDYDASSRLMGEAPLKLSIPSQVPPGDYVSSKLLWWLYKLRERKYVRWKIQKIG